MPVGLPQPVYRCWYSLEAALAFPITKAINKCISACSALINHATSFQLHHYFVVRNNLTYKKVCARVRMHTQHTRPRPKVWNSGELDTCLFTFSVTNYLVSNLLMSAHSNINNPVQMVITFSSKRHCLKNDFLFGKGTLDILTYSLGSW
jgi:hypothetical protein